MIEDAIFVDLEDILEEESEIIVVKDYQLVDGAEELGE